MTDNLVGTTAKGMVVRRVFVEGAFAKSVLNALLLGVVSLALSATTFAHRGHGMWTEVIWTGEGFEITHQIHVADALVALEQLDDSIDLEQLQGQALMAIYVEQRFAISVDGKTAELKTLGAEIDDDFLYVYQEWDTSLPEGIPQIQSTALEDIVEETHTWVHYKTPEINESFQLNSNRQ